MFKRLSSETTTKAIIDVLEHTNLTNPYFIRRSQFCLVVVTHTPNVLDILLVDRDGKVHIPDNHEKQLVSDYYTKGG